MSSQGNFYAKWALAFIAAGVVIRCINLDLPILEGAISRQIQTAAITRNLLESGFDVLHPKINVLPEPRLYVLEPPFYNLLVALFYKIFGVGEYWGRLLSIISFAGTGWYLYRIGSSMFNESIARAAVFSFSFFPLSIIYTRGFQPDPTALFFSVAMIFYYSEWLVGRPEAFWKSCIFGILTFTTKQTYAFLIVSMVLYGWYLRGPKIFTAAKSWFYLVLTLSPCLLWTFHARSLQSLFPGSQDFSGNFEWSNWFAPETFLNYEFYKVIFQWLTGIVLTPIGFSLFFLGLFLRSEKRGDVFLYCWLAGIVFFNVLFHRHTYTHEYYHLALLPVGALFIGKSWWFLLESKESNVYRDSMLLKYFKGFALALTVFMVMGYSNSGFRIPGSIKNFEENLRALNSYTADNDLVIVSERFYLYYGHNNGWVLPGDPDSLEREHLSRSQDESFPPTPASLLKIWRESGAAYLFITTPKWKKIYPEFSRYVLDSFPVVAQKENGFTLLDLKVPLPVNSQS